MPHVCLSVLKGDIGSPVLLKNGKCIGVLSYVRESEESIPLLYVKIGPFGHDIIMKHLSKFRIKITKKYQYQYLCGLNKLKN